jgi:DNA-directed RNA polymerase specialized sigma24 family protein
MTMGRQDKLLELDKREKVTHIILDVLDHLPESQRKMFVWKHYQGLEIGRIAENLHCSYSDVEQILKQVGSVLACRTAQMLP